MAPINAPPDVDHETETLLACLRKALGSPCLDRQQTVPVDGLDWQRMLSLAQRHKVVPLLRQGLSTNDTTAPQQIQTYLDRFYHWNAARNLGLYRHLLQLLELLRQANIQAIAYKGPLLALNAYGNIALRQCGDLDLLLDTADYPRARSLLLQQGYALAGEYDWECALRNNRHGYVVDIHKALTPARYPVRLDLPSIQSRLIARPPTAAPIKMPCAEDTLLILCIQLAKDAWAHCYKPVQLAKVCDIAALTDSHPELDWDSVCQRAQAIGCRRILYVALSVSQRLLGARVHYPPALTSPAIRETLVQDIIRKLTLPNESIGEASITPDRFHFAIRERWREKLYPQYYAFTRRLPPNELDHAIIQLPRQLAILYWAIRPFRLFRDSSRRGLRLLGKRVLSRWRKP